MIDNKGRIFGKISIIDIFVVAMIIFIVLFGVMRIGNARGIGRFEPPVSISMTFMVEELEDFTAHRVRMGDPVSDNHTGAEFGNVQSIVREPRIEYNPDASGVLVPSIKPYFYHFEVTTIFEGHRFHNGILVDGHTFFTGEQMVARVGDTSLFIRVSDITVHD